MDLRFTCAGGNLAKEPRRFARISLHLCLCLEQYDTR